MQKNIIYNNLECNSYIVVDENRVVLQPFGSYSHDYINASNIKVQ